MKKDSLKKGQKLSLNRETLRNLKDGELMVAVGAVTAGTQCSSACTRISCLC